MHSYTAVVECCAETGLYVGYIPGIPGAHTQAESLEELEQNLREVIQLARGGRSTTGDGVHRAADFDHH